MKHKYITPLVMLAAMSSAKSIKQRNAQKGTTLQCIQHPAAMQEAVPAPATPYKTHTQAA